MCFSLPSFVVVSPILSEILDGESLGDVGEFPIFSKSVR